MNDLTGFRIGIAGLGLIGGSLAKAFQKAGFLVAGYDHDPATVKIAAESGIFDTVSLEPQAVLACDLILIALYPDGIIEFVKENARSIKKGCIVIDCCGVKEYVTKPLTEIAKRSGFHYIGGHPMAGTEKRGFEASVEGLFQNASFILTPCGDLPDDILTRAKDILKTAEFKQIVITTPAHHDRMIAFTSQLPHVLACAYVKSPYCPQHKGYSAGSYRDVSRVAHINPELWSELFVDNSAALCAEIDRLIGHLSEMGAAIANRDRGAVTELLYEALNIKDGVDQQ